MIKSYMYNKSSREINSSIYAMRHENEMIEMDISLAHGNINGKNAEFAGFEDNGLFYFTAVKDGKHAQIYLLDKEQKKKIKELDPVIDNHTYHNANGAFSKIINFSFFKM